MIGWENNYLSMAIKNKFKMLATLQNASLAIIQWHEARLWQNLEYVFIEILNGIRETANARSEIAKKRSTISYYIFVIIAKKRSTISYHIFVIIVNKYFTCLIVRKCTVSIVKQKMRISSLTSSAKILFSFTNKSSRKSNHSHFHKTEDRKSYLIHNLKNIWNNIYYRSN